MRSALTVILSLAGLFPPALAAPPAWTTDAGRLLEYPAATHLSSLAVVDGADDEAEKLALANAQATLAGGVRVRVSSRLDAVQQQTDDEYSQRVRAAVSTTASLGLRGTASQVFRDKPNRRTYAVVTMEKAAAQATYAAARQALQTRLMRARDKAAEAKGTAGARLWLATLPLLDELAEVDAVLLVVAPKSERAPAGVSAAEVHAHVRQLLKRPVVTLADVTPVLVEQLALQGGGRPSVLYSPPVYQDSGLVSAYGLQLDNALKAATQATLGWRAGSRVATLATRSARIGDALAEASGATHVLRSSLWEVGDTLSVRVSVTPRAGGAALAAEALVPMALLKKAGLAWQRLVSGRSRRQLRHRRCLPARRLSLRLPPVLFVRRSRVPLCQVNR